VKINMKQLRQLILNESKRLIAEEGRGARRGVIPVVNMNRLRRDPDGDPSGRDVAEKMEELDDNVKRKAFAPVSLYNQAIDELGGEPDTGAIDNVTGEAATAAGIDLSGDPLSDIDDQSFRNEVEDAVQRGVVVIPDEPDDEWQYKVIRDSWWTQKKADYNEQENANSTDGWIFLGSPTKSNLVAASAKLDGIYPNMRSEEAVAATADGGSYVSRQGSLSTRYPIADHPQYDRLVNKIKETDFAPDTQGDPNDSVSELATFMSQEMEPPVSTSSSHIGPALEDAGVDISAEDELDQSNIVMQVITAMRDLPGATRIDIDGGRLVGTVDESRQRWQKLAGILKG